ncbi:MAG: alpha-N-arabinofuranosidase, partial [Fusicatenibacter sp.]|nr:alpha-N-arabinofuranosidase [Fusicatenibacter sp.]
MQKITFRKLIGENYIYPELQGHFIEFLGSCIYDGIWVGEDSEIPNYHGIRKDLVDAFQKLHPPVIRWPGGCYADVYHWRNGIGPRENRPVTYNENFGTFETDPNQFGTHEMMEFCEMIGAKPWFNINMMTGSPAEMREWMEYCNRRESTTLTRERKVNGHEAPFQVEYWGIGNEVWDGGGKMTPQMYADEYRKFTSSCPSFGSGDQAFPPKCIASGPDGNKPKERVAWTKDFFKEMGKYRMPSLYGYDLHFYNWNLKQLQTEKKFDEKQWYDVIN